MFKKQPSMLSGENAKNGILQLSAVSCTGTAKVLRAAADQCDAAAKYCKSKQTGTFTWGISFQLGDHVHKFGNAPA